MTIRTNRPARFRDADVMVVIRAPLEQYPPTLNQVALLSESGLNVTVVDARHDDYQLAEFRFLHRVHRIHAIEHTQSFKDRPISAVEKIRRSIGFRRCVQNTIRRQNPSVVIAYDPNAMAAVGKIWNSNNRPRLIWHFHELFLPRNDSGGWMTRRNVRFAADQCEHPDLVIFPDAERARVYRDEVGRAFDELIVMNCPRRLGAVPKNHLRPALRSQSVPAESPIVLFQGWIGPSRCFEAIIRSMSHWPANAVFVLIGPVSQHYQETLTALADEIGMGSRVRFIGTVPYQELPSWTVGATIGLSIISDKIEKDLNWRYTAGAVNKRFEYMSAGLPQVANVGPGMTELIEKTNTGLLAEPGDAAAIGQQIASMLCDPERLQQMAHVARTVHMERFCYEEQFNNALHLINSWCGIPKTRLSRSRPPQKDVA
ncbi:MAG: glycosyltransferase family 4 protein [Fuerstiella sp.]|jgi:glycosyltransferase involved in cell wall biosynthesis|nr:glycosyltransferase family 4 protein [Fuerstiella sp.]MCP4508703.1 glycosyltransferase family 4 protein [Fuerstiella sp.]